MKTLKIMTMMLVSGLMFATSAQAQTADDCIAEYENLKSRFEAAAPDAAVNCVAQGNIISLDAEGPLPAGCSGSWDHWHLEASVAGNKEGSCKMMLRGLEGNEDCSSEEFVLDLPANENAAWRNFLRNECR